MLRWFGYDPSMFQPNRGFRLPAGIVAAADSAAGQWIENRLRPWGSEGVRLWSFLPDTFPAYARIFHPFYLGDDAVLDQGEQQPVRWATVAGWTGVTVHPLMQIDKVAKVPLPYNIDLDWGECPEMGSLPFPESVSLTSLLREFTTTPDSCYLGYWEGNGYFPGGKVRFFGHEPGLISSLEDMAHNLWGKLRPAPDVLAGVPRLIGQHREYLIYFGSLDILPSLSQYPPWGLSPNLWWPEDRAWCVATEIDGYDTFVGGSQACIERIVACPDLEALPFSLDDRIDGGADMVNT